MRIAVIADVHGNLQALEAVLGDASGRGVDLVVVAGDTVNGAPDSRACWDLVRSLGYPLLRGNHERYLFDLGTEREQPEWREERFGLVHWAAARFSRAELDEMSALPLAYRLPDEPDLLIVHASTCIDNFDIGASTPLESFDRAFGQEAAKLIVRGHNHIPNLRLWGERTIVTAGSVGMPLDGDPLAKYLLLDKTGDGWRFEHLRVEYDVDAALQRFREDDYLKEAGAMARLMMREIATGSHQMSPFLRYWSRCLPEVRDLGTAIDRFLNAY